MLTISKKVVSIPRNRPKVEVNEGTLVMKEQQCQADIEPFSPDITPYGPFNQS